jgi:hypothetical protein
MPKYKNPDSEINIRRIDTAPTRYKQTHGFQVHVRRGEKTWTKQFSDAIFGSKQDALIEARKFRDQLKATLPESKTNAPVRANAVGYTIIVRKKKGGAVSRFVSASVRDRKGHAVNRKFHIEGDDQESAVAAALAWRFDTISKRTDFKAAAQ